MDEAKIEQKSLKEKSLLLEKMRRLQKNQSISPVVVKNALKQTAERKHSSRKVIERDAEDFAAVVGKKVRTMFWHTGLASSPCQDGCKIFATL